MIQRLPAKVFRKIIFQYLLYNIKSFNKVVYGSFNEKFIRTRPYTIDNCKLFIFKLRSIEKLLNVFRFMSNIFLNN